MHDQTTELPGMEVMNFMKTNSNYHPCPRLSAMAWRGRAAGTTTGQTDTPRPRTPGTAFNVAVNAVAANWNMVNTLTDPVAITSRGANAALAMLPPNSAHRQRPHPSTQGIPRARALWVHRDHNHASPRLWKSARGLNSFSTIQ